MDNSSGPASYGNQIAAAAPEVLSSARVDAKTESWYPRSASTAPHVSPEIPAPTIAILTLMVDGSIYLRRELDAQRVTIRGMLYLAATSLDRTPEHDLGKR